MRKLYIAPFDTSFYIYKSDEGSKFEKATGTSTSGDYGGQCGNSVWIGCPDNVDRIGICYHEAVHLTDWLLEDRLCSTQGTLESNTEIRAYLVEFIGNAIRKYCTGE